MSKRKGILFEAAVAIVIVFLVFAMYAMTTQSSSAVAIKWNTTPTYNPPQYMYLGDSGILYSFSGNHIYAIGKDGKYIWNQTIPAGLSVSTDWLRLKDTSDIAVGGFTGVNAASPTVTESNGILYVYARPNITGAAGIQTTDNYTMVFAISPNGQILWNKPLPSSLITYGGASIDAASISAYDGRVYVFHDYTETVIDANSGNKMWDLYNNVSDPAAVDERGYVYTVSPAKSDPVLEGGTYDYRIPSSTVNAYYPNGTLAWSQNIGEPVIRQYLREDVRPQFDTLPLYRNGLLYLPLQDGILAMNPDGTINWIKRLNATTRLLELMPMDSAGNIYLEHVNDANASASALYVISEDGTLVAGPTPYNETGSLSYKAARNGILYSVNASGANNGSLTDLDTLTLNAYDIKNATALWSYQLPANKKGTMTLDATDIRDLLDPYNADKMPKGGDQRYQTSGLPTRVSGIYDVSVLPEDDRIYVSYYDYNYEYPIVLGGSRCAYAWGVGAVDTAGAQVWQQPTDTPVTAMAERNGTLFYSTLDGTTSAATFDTATGLTIAVVAYVLIRFFVFGAVSRARSRLDKNENRNIVLKFIADHPGSTLYEIARGVNMNLGTARYHVLILGINHRITSRKADNKYVRFFLNSNTFSKEEQVLLSFIRREPTRKVLGLLLEKPGLTNVDLSRELDIAESTISKYIKELSSKDIIMKEPLPGGRFAYSISKEQKERVAMALESLKCAA